MLESSKAPKFKHVQYFIFCVFFKPLMALVIPLLTYYATPLQIAKKLKVDLSQFLVFVEHQVVCGLVWLQEWI